MKSEGKPRLQSRNRAPWRTRTTRSICLETCEQLCTVADLSDQRRAGQARKSLERNPMSDELFHGLEPMPNPDEREKERLRVRNELYRADPANAQKIRARNMVKNATISGSLVRPVVCAACKRVPETGRIEAHHPDYSRPLEVEWLCSCCHKRRHLQIDAADARQLEMFGPL